MAVVPFDGDEEAEVVVPLEVQEVPPELGSLDLLVTDADGRVFEGAVLLSCYDAMGDHHGRLVRTDAAGKAELLGLSAGTWQLRAIGGPRSVDARVPEAGRSGAHVLVGDWPDSLTEESYRSAHAELSADVPAGVVDETAAEIQRRRILGIQDLEQRWRILRPQRKVRLDATSWPSQDGDLLLVTALWGPGVSWVVRRHPRTFTSLTISPERWSVSLLRDGRVHALAEFDADPPEPPEPAAGADDGRTTTWRAPGALLVELPRPATLPPDSE